MKVPKIFLLLFVIPVIVCQETPPEYKGLLVSIDKPTLARDLLFIIKTIILNAKFGTYSDIGEESSVHYGFYLTNIEITDISYNPHDITLEQQLRYDEKAKMVSLNSSDPFIKYKFVFKWAAKVYGIHIGFGSGTAEMTSKAFYTYVKLAEVLGTHLKVDFDLNNVHITGIGVNTGKVKEWVEAKFKTDIREELLRAIGANSGFIAKYVFSGYEKVTKRIKDGVSVVFKSYPYSFTEYENKLAYSFDTKIYVNNVLTNKVDLKSNMVMLHEKYSVGIHVSRQLIPIMLSICAQNGVFDEIFDLREIGFAGTVQDFIQAMPELETQFSELENVTMSCQFTGNLTEKGKDGLEFPMVCEFEIENYKDKFLTASIVLLMQYAPSVDRSLYSAVFSGIEVASIMAKPSSSDIGIFLKRLFTLYGQKRFEHKVFDIPSIRYTPLRPYKDMIVGTLNGVYVSLYNDTNLD